MFPNDLNVCDVTDDVLDDAVATDDVTADVTQLQKVERDKKTMDQELVELTNKLLDAKTTIDRLEELNVSKVK